VFVFLRRVYVKMAEFAMQPESVSMSSSSRTFVAAEKASKQLRVTCYGSSSSKTPEDYIQAAWSVGYILAQRGHICVNGAGATGCMGAMNKGAVAGNGHIVGVIHEMFVVDGADWFEGGESPFGNTSTNTQDDSLPSDGDRPKSTPIRELVIAGTYMYGWWHFVGFSALMMYESIRESILLTR
jgi:hypothetical protein